MRLRGTFTRGRAALAAAVAAVAASGAAVALPTALAASTTSVAVLTVPGSTLPTAAIVRDPSDPNSVWAIGYSGDVEKLNASNHFSAQPISGTDINVGEFGPVAVSGGVADYVADGIHLLKLTANTAGGIDSVTLGNMSDVTPSQMTIGPDGHLYIAIEDGYIWDCTVAGAPACASHPATLSGSPAAPDGIASAGGLVWFTDVAGELASISTAGTVSGPYLAGDFSSAGQDMTSAGDNLYLVDAGESQIDEVSPANPTTFTPIPIPTPSFSGATPPMLQALTTGPDGNVWFTDTANNAVGYLNVNTGAEGEVQIPSGDTPGGGTTNITTGPGDTLVFTLSSPAGQENLIGEIASPFPALATTTVRPTPRPSLTLHLASSGVYVAKDRVAKLLLRCIGKTGTCVGKLRLDQTHTTLVKVKRNGTVMTVKRTTHVSFGSATFSIGAGKSAYVKVVLPEAAYELLVADVKRFVDVRGIATVIHGTGFSKNVHLEDPPA